MSGTGGKRNKIAQTASVVFIVLLALPFGAYAIERSLMVLDPAEQASARFFDVGSRFASYVLYLHMGIGGAITVLAPLQLLQIIRQRAPTVHRVMGYVISIAALSTACAGLFYILRAGTIGGRWMDAGFALYGVLMILCAIQTIRHARARTSLHQIWASRLVILALASWLYRVHYGLWEITTGGIASNEAFTGVFDRIQVFAFYLPYLALYELWRRRYLARHQVSTFKMR